MTFRLTRPGKEPAEEKKVLGPMEGNRQGIGCGVRVDSARDRLKIKGMTGKASTHPFIIFPKKKSTESKDLRSREGD